MVSFFEEDDPSEIEAANNRRVALKQESFDKVDYPVDDFDEDVDLQWLTAYW